MEPDETKQKEQAATLILLCGYAAKPGCRRCNGRGFMVVERKGTKSNQQCICSHKKLEKAKRIAGINGK
jgi:hypothetical protein